MALTEAQKISFLNTIEDEMFLIDHILLPIFSNMKKFSKVIKTHGPDEKGKDIVLISEGDFDQKIYSGIIVKNNPITNASTNKKDKEIVATVSNQILMCIDNGFDSIEEQKNVKFNNIIILTSKSISNSARDSFLKIADFHKFTKLIFWEASELIKHIDLYLPDIYLVSHGALSKYFFTMKEKCENLNELKKISIYKGEDRKLSDVYIEPKIFRRKESVKNGQTTTVYDSTTLSELISKDGKYLISGTAGAGKSTLLRSEIYKMIINYEIKKCKNIPIFLRIKDLVKENFKSLSYEDCIIEYLSKTFSLTKDEVISIFDSKDNFVYFIDGFDELSSEKETDLFFEIISYIEKSNSNIIITTRKTRFFNEQFKLYSRWELSEFTLKEITNFIQKWFKNKNEQLISDLKDHNLLEKLPNTPLVMTLIAILFESDENVEIPANLSELYKMFVELLVGRWDMDRRIETFYKANDKETFLTELALYLHYNKLISCKEDELLNVFNDTSKKLGRKFDNYRLLDELIKDTNLIIKNERDEYEFRHLSFQEYFVGNYLTIKNNIDILIESFPHPWWDQVLYFYCGTRKINDDVLPRIFDKIMICSDRKKILGFFELGYLIQSSYKTDAKIRGKLIRDSIIVYSELVPKFIKEHTDELKNKPEIILYLSLMETFKMHYNSRFLEDIYMNIYEEIKELNYDTFEKALSLFLLVSLVSANGNIDVLADCDGIFKKFPMIMLMEDFLIRCELLEEIDDKKIKGMIKEHSKKLIKRIKNNRELYKKLLE